MDFGLWAQDFRPNLPTHYHRPPHAERLEHARQRFAQFRPGHPHEHRGGTGRVEQWAEEIEDGALAALGAEFPRGSHVFEGRVINLRKEKRKAVLPQRLRRGFRRQERDVAARFPCLATVTPAAAQTMAAVVEMLNVPNRSPPVPTTSRISRARVPVSSGGWIALARKARAKAAISAVVSPFSASRVRKSAFVPGGTVPSMSCSTAAATCSSASGPDAAESRMNVSSTKPV